MSAAIEARGLSKRFGQVSALLEVDLEIPSGVVGLLGPNGAGKTTFIRLVTGQIRPSTGKIRVLGEDPWRRPSVLARVGYCPDSDAMWPELPGKTFLELAGRLKGLDATAASRRAAELLELVGLERAGHRAIQTYSRGMRQRLKMAWSLVADPDLLVLDEPLTGCDPVVRNELIQIIRQQGAQGRTVLVSSHVLHEVEAMTEQVAVLYQGQVLAFGTVAALRNLLEEHPHRILVRLDDPRKLARTLVESEAVTSLSFLANGLVVETTQPDPCYQAINEAVVTQNLDIRELSSMDEDLESVFQYLLARRRGWGRASGGSAVAGRGPAPADAT